MCSVLYEYKNAYVPFLKELKDFTTLAFRERGNSGLGRVIRKQQTTNFHLRQTMKSQEEGRRNWACITVYQRVS